MPKKAYHVSFQMADKRGAVRIYADSSKKALEEYLTALLEKEGITSVEEAKARFPRLKVQIRRI